MIDQTELEERRARFLRAKGEGGICGACGRALVAGETVWWERLELDPDRVLVRSAWWVPVGAECASPSSRAQAEGRSPEHCLGCGRGVVRARSGWVRLALCSRICSRRYHYAGSKERTSS